LPNVGPYIYDVSISGFTRSSIYIYDISSLRVKREDLVHELVSHPKTALQEFHIALTAVATEHFGTSTQ